MIVSVFMIMASIILVIVGLNDDSAIRLVSYWVPASVLFGCAILNITLNKIIDKLYEYLHKDNEISDKDNK